MISFGLIRHFAGTAFKSVLGGGTVPVLLVAGFVLGVSAAYFKGVQHQKTKCTTAALTQTVAAQRHELERLSSKLQAVQAARLAAQQRSINDATKIEQWRGEADDYKRDIAGQTTGCALSDDDAKRLRRIGN